jgi:hypothetical protein
MVVKQVVCNWALKKKFRPNETIEKYIAWLVAKVVIESMV